MYCWKNFFEKLNFEKNGRQQKRIKNYPADKDLSDNLK